MGSDPPRPTLRAETRSLPTVAVCFATASDDRARESATLALDDHQARASDAAPPGDAPTCTQVDFADVLVARSRP